MEMARRIFISSTGKNFNNNDFWQHGKEHGERKVNWNLDLNKKRNNRLSYSKQMSITVFVRGYIHKINLKEKAFFGVQNSSRDLEHHDANARYNNRICVKENNTS